MKKYHFLVENQQKKVIKNKNADKFKYTKNENLSWVWAYAFNTSNEDDGARILSSKTALYTIIITYFQKPASG